MPPEEPILAPVTQPLVDWPAYHRCRGDLGGDFLRILSYFREDGFKSVAAIEEGVRAMNAAAIVLPAHTLKSEAAQFGAEPLSELAETIEEAARICVEHRDTPEGIIADAAALRPLFESSLEALEREANPLVERRRMRALTTGQAFGRNES